MKQPIEATLRDRSVALTSYLGRYCGDPGVTQDLVQETLIRVSRALPGFDRKSSLKTWAFSIATRVAADHWIHRARRRLQAALSDSCNFYKDGDGVLRCDHKQP